MEKLQEVLACAVTDARYLTDWALCAATPALLHLAALLDVARLGMDTNALLGIDTYAQMRMAGTLPP